MLMTVRDKIYKQYEKWWEAYATLKEWIMPQCREYIEKSHFKKKSVLDIGCGTGQYLVYLKSLWFSVAGKDSSPTAVEITKAAIGNEWDITCDDIYTTDIEQNTFDLIISIRTIHHGDKETIEKLIRKIYAALSMGGKIFITLPNYEINNHRYSLADKEEITHLFHYHDQKNDCCIVFLRKKKYNIYLVNSKIQHMNWMGKDNG